MTAKPKDRHKKKYIKKNTTAANLHYPKEKDNKHQTYKHQKINYTPWNTLFLKRK